MVLRTKYSVLELLEQHRGQSLSGEELARRLGVSRTAVWKAVGDLKKEGYHIEAVTNKGYRLSRDTDILSVQGLLPFLDDPELADRIYIFKEVESTNRTALNMMLEGAGYVTVVIAETQTACRGRQGRSFSSPPGKGIYMSIVLRPAFQTLPQAALVTTAASVAVCRAIEKVTGRQLGIKWVNDLFLRDRKVCGILTEAITDFESGTVEGLVLGIGVNFSARPEDFAPEARETAGSLCPGCTDGARRILLAAELINQASRLGDLLNEGGFLDEYRRRSLVLGKWITVLHPLGSYEALALDIDQEGRLLVRLQDGSTRLLNGGEVRIRQ